MAPATILPETDCPSFDESISSAVADDQVAVCPGVHDTVGVAVDFGISIVGVTGDPSDTTPMAEASQRPEHARDAQLVQMSYQAAQLI